MNKEKRIQEGKDIIEQIKKYDQIFVFTHGTPDGDALGSAWGLAKILETNFKHATIKTIGKDSKKSLSKFFPSFGTDKQIPKKSLSIVVDTGMPRSVSSNVWTQSETVIKIDHHTGDKEYGDFHLIDPSYGACSLLITQIAVDQKLSISQEAARYLYIGVCMDTSRFMRVDHKSLSLSSVLLASGFDATKLMSELFSYTANEFNSWKDAYNHLEVFGDTTLLNLPKGYEEKYNLNREYITTFADLMLIPDEANKGMFVAWQEDKKTYIIITRSKTVEVRPLCLKHGGVAGHQTACTIRLKDFDEVMEMFEELKGM